MSKQDYSNITLTEAIQWTVKNCMLPDTRKRIQSRAVAFILAAHLKQASELITELKNELDKHVKET